MGASLRIFVSHSSADNSFCDTFVEALRHAEADVWYDQHNLRTGELLDEISAELRSRPVFMVILSTAAFASPWVRAECKWAYTLYQREPNRVLLPIVAETIKPTDFDSMLYLEGFTRIAGPGDSPHPQDEIISRTLRFLGLRDKDALRQLPAVSPDTYAEELTTRAKVLNIHGRYAEALPLFERAVLLAPADGDAGRSLGYTYAKLTRWHDALDSFDQVLAQNASDAAAWASKGAVLHEMGRDDEAFGACERAIAIDDKHLNAWTNMAGLLYLSGRYNDALSATARAVAIDPTAAVAWHIRGETLGMLNRHAEAVVAFGRAIDARPDFAEAWFSRANSLISMNDVEGALQSAEHSVALDKSNPKYWFGKSAALMKLGRVHEAMAALDEYFALPRIDAQTYQSAVNARESCKKFLETEQTLLRQFMPPFRPK